MFLVDVRNFFKGICMWCGSVGDRLCNKNPQKPASHPKGCPSSVDFFRNWRAVFFPLFSSRLFSFNNLMVYYIICE